MRRKAPHNSLKYAQSAHFRSLFTGIEQRLQAETDSQKWHARGNALDEGIAHRQGIERAHHLPEMAHARQQNLRRATQSSRIANQRVFATDLVQRVLHRPQIARAVIENCDHSSPLVDGNSSFSRASFEHAYFMARAKHLKMASIL
jgi:hypothetical protein